MSTDTTCYLLDDSWKNASGALPVTMTNDYMFRAVFQSSENSLRHLLAALLGIPLGEITSCHIENPIVLGENMGDKDCILDISILLNQNRRINLEMQVGNQANWCNRAVFYLSRLYCSLDKGQDYQDLLPVIHIGILNFTLFPDNPTFYSEYLLSDTKTQKIFTGNYSLRVLQLNQLENATEEEKNSELYQWSMFFIANTWEEIQMLAKNADVFHETADFLCKLSADDKIRIQCEARERYYRDWRSEIRAGEERGEERGEARFSQLTAILLRENRLEDLKRATEDEDYLTRLFSEFELK